MPSAMLSAPWFTTAPLFMCVSCSICTVPVLANGPTIVAPVPEAALTLIVPWFLNWLLPELSDEPPPEPPLQPPPGQVRTTTAPGLIVIPVVVALRLVLGLAAEISRVGVEPAPPRVKDFI